MSQMGYAPPGTPVDRQVTGLLGGMEARNGGFMRFAIQEQGQQYPVRVDTKNAETIKAAQALLGQVVTAQVREQQSTSINPNSGKPYINRYLNAIVPAGQPMMQQPQQQQFQPQPQQQFQGQQPQQGMQPVQQPQYPAQHPQPFASPQLREQMGNIAAAQPSDSLAPTPLDLKIYRQVAWKKAVDLAIAGEIPTDPKDMVEAAEVGMAYLVFGPTRFGVQAFDDPQRGQQQPQQAQQQSEQFVPQAQPEQAPHPADDDIPF